MRDAACADPEEHPPGGSATAAYDAADPDEGHDREAFAEQEATTPRIDADVLDLERDARGK